MLHVETDTGEYRGSRRHPNFTEMCVSHPTEVGARIEAISKSPKKAQDEDHSEALKKVTDKVSGKIDEAFEKLAKKLRAKADHAKAKVESTNHKAKRAIQLRRFELYADAASHLEERLSHRSEISDFVDE